MQRKSLLALSSILVIGLLITVLASSGASAATGCNKESLKGGYGYAISGSIFNNSFTELVDFAVSGRITFDGKGGLAGAETHSFGGQIGSVTETGTYTVNTDCTGTVTFLQTPGNHTVNLNIVLVDGTQQIKAIETDAGAVVSGTLVKQ